MAFSHKESFDPSQPSVVFDTSHLICSHLIFISICDALHGLVPFVQFKKCEFLMKSIFNKLVLKCTPSQVFSRDSPTMLKEMVSKIRSNRVFRIVNFCRSTWYRKMLLLQTWTNLASQFSDICFKCEKRSWLVIGVKGIFFVYAYFLLFKDCINNL